MKKLILILLIILLNSCIVNKEWEVQYTKFPSREIGHTKMFQALTNSFPEHYNWDIYWSYFPFMIPSTAIIIAADAVGAPLKLVYGYLSYPFGKNSDSNIEEKTSDK